MPFDLWLALAVYVVVTTITPGPNNTMLLATGLNHGLRRAWPHLFGVNGGFAALTLAMGLGLGAVLTQVPWMHTALKYAGAAYLLWLALGIARSGPPADGAPEQKPIGFWQAAAFQWVNPKAWIMALGALSAYVPPDRYWSALALTIATYSVLGLPCNIAWVAAGAALRRALGDPKVLRLFNVGMALALALSVLAVVR